MTKASCAVPVTFNLLIPGLPAFLFVGFMLINTLANIAQNTGNVERVIFFWGGERKIILQIKKINFYSSFS